MGFLGWWWWPTIEPRLPELVESVKSAGLAALGRAEPGEQGPGPLVATAASPIAAPPPMATPTAAPEVAAAPFCGPGQAPAFVFGFAALKRELGVTMGEPLECEHANTENGDSLQQTTAGLAVYDQATNSPRFTDGWRSWALTPRGLLAWKGPNAPPELAAGPSGSRP